MLCSSSHSQCCTSQTPPLLFTSSLLRCLEPQYISAHHPPHISHHTSPVSSKHPSFVAVRRLTPRTQRGAQPRRVLRPLGAGAPRRAPRGGGRREPLGELHGLRGGGRCFWGVRFLAEWQGGLAHGQPELVGLVVPKTPIIGCHRAGMTK